MILQQQAYRDKAAVTDQLVLCSILPDACWRMWSMEVCSKILFKLEEFCSSQVCRNYGVSCIEDA